MSNIEVGDYLRIFGMITKVTAIDEDYIDVDNKELICIPKSSLKYTIYKHSKNIIDLIEVGDYVNGVKVANCGKGVFVRRIVQLENNYVITNVDDCKVRSIVTKEQFKSIEYKVGE